MTIICFNMAWRPVIPFLLLVFLLSGCTTFNKRRTDYVYQEVFYLTTRGQTGSELPEERYDGDRGDPAFGVAMIALDPREALSRHARPQPNHVLRQNTLLRPRIIQQLEEMPEGEFRGGLQQYRVPGEPSVEVLVFIHGYKRSFEDAVDNAAHLRHELAFPGPVIAFSWPSTDEVSGYLADLDNLDWSEPQFRHLLGSIGEALPDARIHLMAHSLGNRVLIESLARMTVDRPEPGNWRLGEIIFMAPDYDRDIFMEDIAERLASIHSRMTLYVSAEDIPLMTSTKIFQHPRLGDSSEGVPVVPGVETIDVSDAVNVFRGHGYYEADSATIEDLYHLIRLRQPAQERPCLVPVDTDGGTYWRLILEP